MRTRPHQAYIPIVVGNWKMNGTREMAQALCSEVASAKQETMRSELHDVMIVFCPPATLLHEVSQIVSGHGLATGSQDIDEHESGAHTGQISAGMVRDAGGSYTILGHSERRTWHGETDARIGAKVKVAVDHDLTPIVCLGESPEERENGRTQEVVIGQLNSIIDHCGFDAFRQCVIAYEPVWAIGTGLTATPEQAQEVHVRIRERLDDFDMCFADECRILYGGSMKPENAAELMRQPDIDGGLIGTSSLSATDFIAICRSASRSVPGIFG